MGWLFSCDRMSRSEFCRSHKLGESWDNRDTKDGPVVRHVECVMRAWRGNNLWAAYRILDMTKPDTPEIERFGVLYLVRRGEGGTWGYKDVEFSMGPCEVGCPDAVAKAAGAHLETAHRRTREWYTRNTAARERAARKFTTGEKVFVWGRTYTIADPRGLRVERTRVAVHSADGRLVQVKRADVCLTS